MVGDAKFSESISKQEAEIMHTFRTTRDVEKVPSAEMKVPMTFKSTAITIEGIIRKGSIVSWVNEGETDGEREEGEREVRFIFI